MRPGCRDVSVGGSGMATVNIELAYNDNFNSVSRGNLRTRVIPAGLTVLPPIVTIVLAIATQNVLVSLFAGVWVAAFFIHACASPSHPPCVPSGRNFPLSPLCSCG